MPCELSLTGSLVVGGDCGCSGSSGSGATKVQKLGFGCSNSAFSGIASTDCAVPVSSPSEFVALPVAALDSVKLLYLQTNAPFELRYDGAQATITGSDVYGAVTFVGTEVFAFSVKSAGATTPVSVSFTAGSLSMEAVANKINAAAILAGLGYSPAELNATKTAITLVAKARGALESISITTLLASIGFPSLKDSAGEDPTVVGVSGIFLAQFSPPISGGFEIKGQGSVSALVAS